MRVRVTYNDLSEKEIIELLKDDNVIGIDKRCNEIDILTWLDHTDIDGMAVAYAYDKFGDSDVSLRKFSKIIRDTGKYVTKNMRIGDNVQYCFVAI